MVLDPSVKMSVIKIGVFLYSIHNDGECKRLLFLGVFPHCVTMGLKLRETLGDS